MRRRRGVPAAAALVFAAVLGAGLLLPPGPGVRGRGGGRGSRAHPAASSRPAGHPVPVTAGLPAWLALPGPAASPGPVLPPAVPQPRVPPHPDPLGAGASSYVRSRAGAVLAAVYDVRTHQTWTLGHGRPQAEASIVKLDILETLLAQRARRGAGLPARERSLARRMIEKSDNAAATRLWELAGGAGGIGRFNAAVGLSRTSPSRCLRCRGFPWPGWGLTTTTPADQLALLRQAVEPGPLLPGADRGYVLRLMENVIPSQRWGVSAGIPPGARVALKDGWLPLNATGTDWQVNSIGWVFGLGRDYLIAVMTTGSPTERYGIATVDGLSSLAWQRMGA